MCVICCKPSGVAYPSEEIIRKMWYANDDGAGMCYMKNGKVFIHKGYMNVEDYIKAIDELQIKYGEKLPLIMHFRIGTAGGNVAKNTHPFPVCNNYKEMEKLNNVCNLAVAHNGCIPIDNDVNVSDTMTYIKDYMSFYQKLDNEFYRKKLYQKNMLNQTNSKLAFLNSSGDIVTIGQFTELDGCLYSNTYWQYRGNRYQFASSCYNYSWNDDDYDLGYNEYRFISELGSYAYHYRTGWKYYNRVTGEMIEVPDYILSKYNLESSFEKPSADSITTTDLKYLSGTYILSYFDSKTHVHKECCICDAWVDRFGCVYVEPDLDIPMIPLPNNYYIVDGEENIMALESDDWFNNEHTISPCAKVLNYTPTTIDPVNNKWCTYPTLTKLESGWWDYEAVDHNDEDDDYVYEYNPEITYDEDDVIYYGGSYYICIMKSKGNDPTNEDYWYHYGGNSNNLAIGVAK